jgi:hypothetical protein
MNYEIYGWLMVILIFTLVGAILKVTWMVGVENGYDKGFKKGYSRGLQDGSNDFVKRTNQLKADNDYLMGKVVSLWDRENK